MECKITKLPNLRSTIDQTSTLMTIRKKRGKIVLANVSHKKLSISNTLNLTLFIRLP